MLKRFLAGIVFISVLCSLAFATDVVVDQIFATAKQDAESAEVKFCVTNNLSADTLIEPYVAIYTPQNKLFDIKLIKNTTITAGQNNTFSVNCSVPKNKTGVCGKIFVWNNENLSPYLEAKPFEITIITNQDGMGVIGGKDDAPYTPNY